MSVYHPCAWNSHRPKRASDPLELEVWMIVSYHGV